MLVFAWEGIVRNGGAGELCRTNLKRDICIKVCKLEASIIIFNPTGILMMLSVSTGLRVSYIKKR